MAGFGCCESGPIGMGSVNGGTTCSKVLEVGKADAKSKSEPCDSKVKGFKRHAAFGDVTIGFGGPGAAIVIDPETKIPRRCMHFHASPRKKCTAGVPIGHLSDKEGQCAFKH